MTDDREFVLIVEDDTETAAALAAFLAVQDYISMTATNGQEAIDLLREGHRPCLILLDIMMPLKDGWDFRDELLAEPALAPIPIVVVTADLSAITRATTLRLPLLTKPVDPGQLMSAIAQHC